MNNPPHDYLLQSIEQTLSPAGQLFFLCGNDYLYPKSFPPMPVQEVWKTAKIDTPGIFRRKINILDGNHESESILLTIHLGDNVTGQEMAAGILQALNRSFLPDREHCLYGFLACLKRYYTEFSRSPSLNNFVRNNSAFQYVINAATNEVIAIKSPSDVNLITDPELAAPQLLNSLRERLSDGKTDSIKQENSDKRQRNINISNCTIMGNDYAIISSSLPYRTMKKTERHNQSIEDVAHKIRGKLSAIQSAAGQIKLQKGKPVNDDDITLADIIQSSADSLNRLIDRLSLYNHEVTSGEASADINQTVENIIPEKNVEWDSSSKTRFSISRQDEVSIKVDLHASERDKFACVEE